jgi:hypothetical protein
MMAVAVAAQSYDTQPAPSDETNQPDAGTNVEWPKPKLMQHIGDINMADYHGVLKLNEADHYQLSKLKDHLTYAIADQEDLVSITQTQADWLERFVALLKQPKKPKRGRPKGSKNKPKAADAGSYERDAA